MADDIKKYEKDYKKINANITDCTIANYTKLLKRIKYFRYDTYQGYTQLSEEVASIKNGITEANKMPKNIEGFAKESKTVADVLKGIKWNQGKQLDAALELQNLKKAADENGNSLKKLAKDIENLTKKSGKGAKPDADIQKLEKQIEDDLKELKVFSQKFNLIPKDDLDPYLAYDNELKKILAVKPAKSKYNTQTDKFFNPQFLKKQEKVCGQIQKKVEGLAASAEKLAKQGDRIKAQKCLLLSREKLKPIITAEAAYSALGKKWKKEINDSNDKKSILDSIDSFVKIKELTEKRIADAEAAIEQHSS